MKSPLLFLMILITGLTGCSGRGNEDRSRDKAYLTLGTGSVAGLYFPTGIALANLINESPEAGALFLTVESTEGSTYNADAIQKGKLDLGIIQSDIQYQAYNGQGKWQGNRHDKLRSLLSLHAETLSLIVSDYSGIGSLADLRGKTVDIGISGSGYRSLVIELLKASGLDWQTDLKARSSKPSAAAENLINGAIDGYFYMVGHPSPSFESIFKEGHAVHFVPLTGPAVEQLLAQHPYFSQASIPMSVYPPSGSRGEIPTFGVKAALCASADVPEQLIYTLVKNIYENREKFRRLSPIHTALTPENILESLSIPVHQGALRYYREKGLLGTYQPEN